MRLTVRQGAKVDEGPAAMRPGDPAMKSAAGRRRSCAEGVSLLEVMVAAFLLLVVLFGVAQVFLRGRVQIDYEEDRRKATAVAQARLDGIRRGLRYDDLPDLDGVDTTYIVDGRSFRVSHEIEPATPEDAATTVTLTVHWNAKVAGANVARSDTTTSILARGMP